MNAVVLVIDDNMEVVENISEMLALAGYRVLIATNGQEGIELAVKEQPNIILSDILMPLVDGYTVLKKLRENQSTRNIPVIYVTALEENKSKLEERANAYIRKPFTSEVLLKAISANLKEPQFGS